MAASLSLGVSRNFRRFGALVTLAIWIAANFAPCAQIIEASRYTLRAVESFHGFRLMVLGWLGPLALSIAWYANVPYFYSLWKTFRGQPSRPAAMLGFCLALTALLPHAIFSEVDGWHRAHIEGPALWLWLGSLFANLILASLPVRE